MVGSKKYLVLLVGPKKDLVLLDGSMDAWVLMVGSFQAQQLLGPFGRLTCIVNGLVNTQPNGCLSLSRHQLAISWKITAALARSAAFVDKDTATASRGSTASKASPSPNLRITEFAYHGPKLKKSHFRLRLQQSTTTGTITTSIAQQTPQFLLTTFAFIERTKHRPRPLKYRNLSL